MNARVQPNFANKSPSLVKKLKPVSNPVFEILNSFFSKLRSIKAGELLQEKSFERKTEDNTIEG